MRFSRALSVLAVGAACFAAGYFARPGDRASDTPGDSGAESSAVADTAAAANSRPGNPAVATTSGTARSDKTAKTALGRAGAAASTRTLTVTTAAPPLPAPTPPAPEWPTLSVTGQDDMDQLFDIEASEAGATSETIYVALPLPGAPPLTPPATPDDLETPPRRGALSSEATAALGTTLDRIFNAPVFENALWGATIRSMETGEDIYHRNDEKGFLPASNLKLYTTSVVLAKLGPDFRYDTKVFSTDADLSDGVLNGDLYVQGSGDPTFSARFHGGDTFQVFTDWAKTLKEKGITRIEGDVVVDDDVFDDKAVPEGWGREYLSEWYSAEVSGVALNDNCATMRVSPGAKPGDPLQVRVLPAEGYVEPLVRGTTVSSERGASSVTFARQSDSNVVEVTGAMSTGAKPVEQAITIHNPTGFFAFHLRRVLEKNGITVTGKAFDADDSPKSRRKTDGLTLVAEAQSPPLSVIVKATQKASFNLYADHLLKTLGARKGHAGSFAEGERIVRDFLQSNGVDPQGFVMADGSGLSRLNLVEPRQTLGLLRAMRKLPCFPYFYDSLPSAGHDGGGIGRVSTEATSGRLHAKTGYIRRVLAVSGYVRDADGETLGFSLMLNNYTASASAAVHAQSMVCDLLAKFQGRRAGPPAESGEPRESASSAARAAKRSEGSATPKSLPSGSSKRNANSATGAGATSGAGTGSGGTTKRRPSASR